MQDAGILDGDWLVVRQAKLGDYHKGGRQFVIAWTSEHGIVVKRYGGQSHGLITLRSEAEGAPDIVGQVEEEIRVRGLVLGAFRWRSTSGKGEE
jgi:SOS-response transcriptional repressor LexA